MTRVRAASRAAVTARLTAAAVLTIVLWQGCSVYDRSLLVDGALVPDAARTTDGGHEAGACRGQRWPDRPAEETPTASPNVRVVTALRRIGLGTSTFDAGVSPTGYDLDDDCTCCACGAPASGSLGACRPADAGDVCDDPKGRDNAAGRLFGVLARRADDQDIFSEHNLNARIERGELGMLLEISEYNGQADDRAVLAALYPSNGVVGPDGGVTTARWDGYDSWSRDPEGLLGGGTIPGTVLGIPRYVDDKAYVAGGVLVARIDFPLALGSGGNGNATIELAGGVLTGRLAREGAGYRVENGQIAGRWATRKLLTSLAVYPDPIFPNRHLCGDSPTYAELKKLICTAVDVTFDPASDRGGGSCDALSIAIGFTSHTARLGPARTIPRDPPGCDAGWSDDCTR